MKTEKERLNERMILLNNITLSSFEPLIKEYSKKYGEDEFTKEVINYREKIGLSND